VSGTDLPIGGSTGLSHEHSAAVTVAAEWLCSIPFPLRPRPIVPELQRRFGLTALQAVEAIREANGGGAR
jgi:hypothetical protein